jgi:hypothetical protein
MQRVSFLEKSQTNGLYALPVVGLLLKVSNIPPEFLHVNRI